MKRSSVFLIVVSAAFIAIVTFVAMVAQNYWRPSKEATLLSAVLLPATYAVLVVALFVVRRTRIEKKKARSLFVWAHLACFPASTFLLLYACVQLSMLPMQALLIPGLSLTLGWVAVLPLSIAAFVRSRLWIDLAAIPCCIALGISSFPVMITMT
ncbi:MAG: hypothetical protein HZA32_15890 [Opitutae bacterium]|nr:hypothetical protein [Opitutae bacterium]